MKIRKRRSGMAAGRLFCFALASALLAGSVLPGARAYAVAERVAVEKDETRNVFGANLFAIGQKALEDKDFEKELEAFPESYKPAIIQLHNAHPNWHFIAKDTGTDWDRAVYEEYKFGDMLPEQNVGWWGTRAVSLTWNSNKSSWKSTDDGAYDWKTGEWTTGWDGSSLVIASKDIVEYFLDPRNFLTEEGIFQFFTFRYDGGLTLEDVEEAAARGVAPYLEGIAENPDGSRIYYPEALLTAAEKTGIHPFYLIATISLENGVNGYRKNQIKGNVEGYEGLFNYYNIAAYQDSEHGFDYAWQRALWFAGGEDKDHTSYYRPWNTRQAALTGGASYFAKNYLNAGQDTYYLKRFNVMSTAKDQFNHQFSTDIEGAAHETRIFASLFSDSMKEGELTFNIPYFSGMPEEACPMPTDDSDPRENTGKAFQNRLSLVTSIFRAFLSENVDEEDVKEATLDLFESTAAETAYGIIFSEEARERGLTDEAFVKALYEGLLEEEPSETEAKAYVKLLGGGESRQSIFARIVGSDSFKERCLNLGITPGSYDSVSWDFVVYLYRNVLGREPKYAEVQSWAATLGEIGRAEKFARSLFFSTEAAQIYKDDEDFVRALYRCLLRREASDQETSYWMTYLGSGCSREFPFSGVVSSDEFAKQWDMTGLAMGGYVPKEARNRYPDYTRFIVRFYEVCFGRKYDVKGLNAWVEKLANGAGGAKVAKGFVHSQEFVGLFTDDREYITILYLAFFDRNPDKKGIAAWLAAMDRGMTRDEVFQGFVRSPEFGAICKSFGIEV